MVNVPGVPGVQVHVDIDDVRGGGYTTVGVVERRAVVETSQACVAHFLRCRCWVNNSRRNVQKGSWEYKIKKLKNKNQGLFITRLAL